jgi:acyl carrier protein
MRQELRRFVIDNFLFGKNGDSFTDDESFLEKGIIDSTGVLELVAFLQSKYGLVIQDQDLIPENLDSIDNLVRFAETRLYEKMVK